MPRRPRLTTGGLAYHVLNRRAGRLPLFEKSADYAAFEKILQEAVARTRIRIATYCLMPNHWHLLLWPRQDGELSDVLRWITVTHSQRWHAHRHTAGTGPVYQGRFKSFPVQTDEHFLVEGKKRGRESFLDGLLRRRSGQAAMSFPCRFIEGYTDGILMPELACSEVCSKGRTGSGVFS
jgi:putative transposase